MATLISVEVRRELDNHGICASFSRQQIEDSIIVVIGPLVERVKEGAPDAFVGVGQYPLVGTGAECLTLCNRFFGPYEAEQSDYHSRICHPR